MDRHRHSPGNIRQLRESKLREFGHVPKHLPNRFPFELAGALQMLDALCLALRQHVRERSDLKSLESLRSQSEFCPSSV